MKVEAGRLVRKGQLRVDARKAITKLRDHLLVDLHLYAVEVVRSAVLAGASRVDVTYDADDVILTFDGRALAPEELPRLFEHLTGGEEGDHARSTRLLALAVNAALGLAPAWISLTTASGGAAARLTWTPELVTAIERGDGALPAPEVIERPADMPPAGTRLQLRRKVGWETVRRAAARTAPREIALLAEAVVCPRVPLFIQGRPAIAKERRGAVARASFSVPDARSAHVEITRSTEIAPHVDHCELGLLLVRAGFAFGRHFPMAEHLGVAPPVRLVLDADALPTNASRSAVREDTRLARSLQAAAAGALADAIAGMVATLSGRGEVPEGVTVEGDREALESALGAFLCCAEASIQARVALPEALRWILDVPLFRDGLGRPMSRAQLPAGDPLLVWSGKEPVPPEMAPWASSIVWLRGDPARAEERPLAMRERVHPERLVALVKRGAERWRKLLAGPAGDAAVPDDAYLCRRRFAFEEGPLAGLAGEVAIAASPQVYVRNLGLRVFLAGRCYQTFPLPEATVPLPCVIALEWDGHVTPTFAYEGIEASEDLRRAVGCAVREAVLLCEELAATRAAARGLPGDAQPFDAAQAAVLRSALATAVLAAQLPSAPGFDVPSLAELPGLVEAPIWPTAADRFMSLQVLGQYAARTGAVCVVAPGAAGSAPDDRPVVRAPAQELELLRACLHPRIQIVRYDAAMDARGADPRDARSQAGTRGRARERMAAYAHQSATSAQAPVLRIEGPRHRCFVTLGQSEVRVWHGAAEVCATPLDPTFGGATIAIDDDTLVPTDRWDGVLFAEDQGLAGLAERAFAGRLAAAVRGERRDELSAGALWAPEPFPWPEDPRHLSAAVRRYLIDRAARRPGVGPDDAQPVSSDEDAEIAAHIRALPILTMIGPDGEPAPASLAEVAQVHPPPHKIPCLRSAPPFRPARWRPVLAAEEVVRGALSRWSGGRLRSAEDELQEQQRTAAWDLEYQQFLRRPILDITAVGPRGDSNGPVVALQEGTLEGVAAALPAPGVSTPHALVEVLLVGRFAGEEVLPDLPIPLVARFSTADPKRLRGLAALSEQGLREASERVRRAAQALAMRIVERAREPGGEHTLFGDVRALRLVLAVLRFAREESLSAALRTAPLRWPTVQGASCPWGGLRSSDGQLWAGAQAYASWISASPPADLDRPILHVPRSEEGAAILGILEQLRVKVRDVTGALASLQAKRVKGAADRPRLAERPVHPALARDLDRADSPSLEGEIALYESGEAVAEIHTLDGETRRIPLELPFPARAVARTDVLTRSSAVTAARALAREAIALLASLAAGSTSAGAGESAAGAAPALDELPPFVRAHLRALVCGGISKEQRLPATARSAPIFPDVDGGTWSLDQLRARSGDWSCTFDPPPYPKARQEGRTLVLTAAEHLQLHPHVPILNITEWMRRDLEAERRREGPQVEHVRFDGAARAHLLSAFEVNDGPLTGEIGVLLPGADAARGIQLLYTRRPLCRLDDGPGWPIAAVLNDDSLHPDRWFSKVWPAQETRLRAAARRLASEHLRETLSATLPPDRRAGVFLDMPVPPVETYGSSAPMTLTGALYLPATWPEAPSARIFVQGVERPFEGPVMMASAPIGGALPIGGTFFIAHGEAVFGRGAAGRVALALRSAMESLLAPLAAASPEDAELRAYLWNARLLGGVAAGSPEARGAGGEAITVEQVLEALEKGEIWLTDGRGWADGDFPGGAPAFVLRDEPSPLVRVLRARAADRLRSLGGRTAHAPPPSLAPPPAHPEAAPDITAPAPPESKRRPARSWLGAVIDRVSDALSPRPGAEPPPSEIAAAVERALRALRLRDEPVIVVREARRGRLLRYDRTNRVITINVAHAAIAKIAAAPSPASVRRACLALTAAAVTEVNIALDHVTDHDESEALLELLRQDAAAAAQPRVV